VQQDELRSSVWSDPYNGDLIKVGANCFGRLQGQVHSKVALLCGPLGTFFAAGAFDCLESQLLKLSGELCMSLVVGFVRLDGAAWVVAGQECAIGDRIASEQCCKAFLMFADSLGSENIFVISLQAASCINVVHWYLLGMN